MTNTLTLTDVSVRYPDGDRTVTALDHVSLTAAPGTVTAVVGESGCGKSTLLSVAAGLTVPDAGQVHRDRTGMVFQSANLFSSLRVREQLLIVDHIQGRRPGAAEKRKADALLERVGLGGYGDRRVHQLSGGQRQRVNIARALTDPPGCCSPTNRPRHWMPRSPARSSGCCADSPTNSDWRPSSSPTTVASSIWRMPW